MTFFDLLAIPHRKIVDDVLGERLIALCALDQASEIVGKMDIVDEPLGQQDRVALRCRYANPIAVGTEQRTFVVRPKHQCVTLMDAQVRLPLGGLGGQRAQQRGPGDFGSDGVNVDPVHQRAHDGRLVGIGKAPHSRARQYSSGGVVEKGPRSARRVQHTNALHLYTPAVRSERLAGGGVAPLVVADLSNEQLGEPVRRIELSERFAIALLDERFVERSQNVAGTSAPFVAINLAEKPVRPLTPLCCHDDPRDEPVGQDLLCPWLFVRPREDVGHTARKCHEEGMRDEQSLTRRFALWTHACRDQHLQPQSLLGLR